MRKKADRAVKWLLGLLLIISLGPPLQAHEIRPAIIDLEMVENGQLRLVKRLNLEALIAGIGSEHKDTSDSQNAAQYERLRRLPPGELERHFISFLPRLLAGSRLAAAGVPLELDLAGIRIPETGDTDLARDSVIELQARVPAGARGLVWRWDKAFGANVLRVKGAGGDRGYSAYLQAGESSDEIPLAGAVSQSSSELFLDYLVIGFEHILPRGLDHILFVVGLFLLNARFKSLLWQVSSFTLAHTVTLALGIYGIVQLSPAIVEPLIAASIVYVCVENMLSDRLSRWRPVVVFLFGLLHGLGFAGVLREIGLAPAHFVSGLIAFNIGVELGQLAVIAGCFLTVGIWFREKPWYRTRITVPASMAIALIGSYWFVQRLLLV